MSVPSTTDRYPRKSTCPVYVLERLHLNPQWGYIRELSFDELEAWDLP